VENIDDQVVLLLRDDRLIHWVLSPDEESIAFWEQWMKDNPEKVPALFKARGIVHDLAYTERPEDAAELAESIWSGIGTELEKYPVNPPATTRRRGQRKVLLAASLVVLVVIGGGIAWYHQDGHSTQPEQKVANLLVRQDLDRVNQTDRSQVVYLVDGSRVTLQPGSGIRYAAFLQKDKREVYLQGNAFFEVAKDTRRPFCVYSGDLMVRVLGTSFDMKTNHNSGEIMILVRTGKVAVSTTSRSASGTMKEPLILTQNQKLIYKRQNPDWVPVAVNSQDLSPERMPAAKPISFDFEETPVVKIFQILENAYGIPIHYDAAVFSNCSITTDLTDETFDEKLKIICTAIGATYQIDEEGVIIEGKPCK
jgi:transmembrane sensor